MIHRGSTESGVDLAPLRSSRRSMGSDQKPAAWAGRACRGDGSRQSVVRGGRALPLPHRNALARSSRAVRGSDQDPHPVFAVGEVGVWARIFQHLADDADNEYAMIDSTIVRAHQHSAGAQKRWRGPSDRTIAGRVEHENPCSGRRPGQSRRLLPNRRPRA